MGYTGILKDTHMDMCRHSLTRRQLLAAAAASGIAATAGLGASDDVNARIAAAIPSQAPARPARDRRLLIFDLNVNYGGHGSIATANTAFTMMGEKTGAFRTVVSRDPAVFAPESLKGFDAVFFNNNVGNLFTDPALRRSLVEFVYSGGGLMGVHGTTVAFTQWPGAVEDWPEFGIMLGARGANHRENTEHVFIKLDDPDHPVVAAFGGRGFEYRDEFFRYQEVYSRNRVRVLLSIDTDKTPQDQGRQFGATIRQDNDYALAWVRGYGRGRVFHSTIAHHPSVFWDPKMLEFYLAAAQFVLGDLPAPTTPSARLTGAVRAQERLGWRLGMNPGSATLFEAIDAASQAGLLYLTARMGMPVGGGIAGHFEPDLDAPAREHIRLKLDAAAIRLLTCSLDSVPKDEAACRQLFEFARKMGVEALSAEVEPDGLDALERLCDEYDISLALRNLLDDPKKALTICAGRGKRIGLCCDIDRWARAGIDPAEALSDIGDRLAICVLPGEQTDAAGKVLDRLRRQGRRSILFVVEPAAGMDTVVEAFHGVITTTADSEPTTR